jgi:mannosyl-oligosaccharide alpha-1,2-mannosidase
MKLTYSAAVLLGVIQHVSAAPANAEAQNGGFNVPFPDIVRALQVKKAFKESWDGYYEHAFPHDNLHPISNTFDDDRLVALIEFNPEYKRLIKLFLEMDGALPPLTR